MLKSLFSILLPDDRQVFTRLAFLGLWSACLSVTVYFPALRPVLAESDQRLAAYILATGVSHLALLNAAGVLLASLAYMLTRSRGMAFGLGFVLLLFLNLALFADVRVFSIFRFHINAMVLGLVMSPAGWDSLDLGAATVAKASLAVGLIVLAQLAGLILAVRGRRGVFWLQRRAGAVLAATLAALLVVNNAGYAYGDLLGHRGITQVGKLLPLYQPLTVKRLAAKAFGYKADGSTVGASIRTVGELNYPLRPIELAENGRRPNIVLVVLDAWRFDMLNEMVTPNLTAFAKSAVTFRNHYSGGNASRFGVFSLLYGLPGSYWHEVLNQRRSSVLMDTLQQAGYEFRITSSTDLRWPEFRQTAFANLNEHVRDTFATDVKHERDRILTDEFTAFAAERAADPDGKPFFYFMFYDASHGPYSYPPEFEKFVPGGEVDYVTADTGSVNASRQRYMNALFYLDSLCKEVMDAVLGTPLAEDTILVFTGDHGEEFLEMGYWGHTSAFDAYQTKVPFVAHWPGRQAEAIDYLTSHHDFAPTLLAWLGASNDPADHSIGADMFTHGGHRYVLSAGWDDAAYIDGSLYCVFPTKSHSMLSLDVRDERYKPVSEPGRILERIRPDLLQVVRDMGRFYK